MAGLEPGGNMVHARCPAGNKNGCFPSWCKGTKTWRWDARSRRAEGLAAPPGRHEGESATPRGRHRVPGH